MGLSLAFEEDQSVASGTTLVKVDGDITFCHAEVNKEVTNLASTR